MRRTNASIAMVLLAALGLSVPARSAVPGDIDGDTQVTVNDVRLGVMISGGLFNALSQMVTNGDVASASGNTPDGRITLLDAVRILRAINGLDTLGTSSAPAPSAPLRDSLTLTVTTAKNYKLPAGYTVSGTATDTFGQSITSQAGLPLVTGSVDFAATSSPGLTGSAQAAANTGAYSVVLGAAAYNVTISSNVVNVNLSTGKLASYTVKQAPGPPSLTVSGNTTQNFVRPPLPQPGTVAGTVAGTNITVSSVTLTQSDGGSGASAPASGSYSLTAPPGTGHISIGGKYVADTTVGFGEYQFSSPVTLASGATVTHNITVPTLGAIHGTVTVPATTAFSSVFCGNYLLTQAGTTDEFFSEYPNQAANPGAYHLALPPGTYPMLFNLSYPSKPNSTTTINYVTQATFTSADVVQNFTLPALGAAIVLSGNVQDSAGKALSGANVTLAPHLTGTPPPGYYATGSATTDASGNYSMNILPGTYDVQVSPP